MANKFADPPKTAPSRRGKKHIGGYYPPDVSKRIRQLALEEETTMQELVGEGLELLFESRRLRRDGRGNHSRKTEQWDTTNDTDE